MLELIHDAVSEARHLHRGRTHGEYFAVLQKDKDAKSGMRQTMSAVSDMDAVVRAIGKAPDTYISQARFKRPFRRVSMLSGVDALWVDVDSTQKVGRAPDATLINEMIDRLADHGVPEPTYIVKSGRGLYAKWILDKTVYANSHPVWSATQKMMAKLLQPFGADQKATDAARVLRPIGSLHSGVNHEVSIERMSGRTVSLDDISRLMSAIKVGDILRDDVVRDEKPDVARRRARHAQQKLVAAIDQSGLMNEAALDRFTQEHKPIMLGRKKTVDTLNWARFLDLRDLAIMRGGFRRGERDLFLFWMINHLALSGIINPENFMLEVESLLEAFPESDDFKPVESGYLSTLMSKVRAHARGEKVTFNGVEYTPIYTPKNDTLINLFQITDDEQLRLNTIISDQVKRARREAKELIARNKESRQDRKRHIAQIVTERSPLKSSLSEKKKALVETGMAPRTARRWISRLGDIDVKKRAVRTLLEHGKSAREVSDITGVPLSSVYRWKRGPGQHELARRSQPDPMQTPVRKKRKQALADLEAWAAQRESWQNFGNQNARNDSVGMNATSSETDRANTELLIKRMRALAQARGKNVDVAVTLGDAQTESQKEVSAPNVPNVAATPKVSPFAAVMKKVSMRTHDGGTPDASATPRQVITSFKLTPIVTSDAKPESIAQNDGARDSGKEPIGNDRDELNDRVDQFTPIAPIVNGGAGDAAPESLASNDGARDSGKEPIERSGRESGGAAGNWIDQSTWSHPKLPHPDAPDGSSDVPSDAQNDVPVWEDDMLPPGSKFSREEWNAARDNGMWHVVEIWSGSTASLMRFARSDPAHHEDATMTANSIGKILDGYLLLEPTAESPWKAQAVDLSMIVGDDEIVERLSYSGYRVLIPKDDPTALSEDWTCREQPRFG